MASLIELFDQQIAASLGQNVIDDTSVLSNIPAQGKTDVRGPNSFFGGNIYDSGNPTLFARNGGKYSLDFLPLAAGGFDVFAISNWLRNIGNELFGNTNFKQGATTAATSVLKSKGFQFVASQFLLAALNPTDTEVGGILNATWNPLSLPVSAVPLVRPSDVTSVTLGPAVGFKYETDTSRIDKYTKQIRKEELVFDKPEDVLRPGILPTGASEPSALGSLFVKTGFDRIRKSTSVLIPERPKDTPENVDVRFWEFGEVDGIVLENNLPLDNQLYMPFMFQDLRDNPPQFLYFRAFMKPESIAETFTPDWALERYYGRVEQVPIYMGTMRMISFSFDVVAFQPADLKPMYRKLHKLQSMVYPLFDNDGFLEAGPIIKMRIGDLFSTMGFGKKGVPGYLTSLDFAYGDIWNLENDLKVPRNVTVSLAFTALHEGNPGIYRNDVVTKEKDLFTFGTGFFEENDKIFYGDETSIRGILTTIERSGKLKQKNIASGEPTT